MTEKLIKATVERLLEKINAISGPGPGYTRPSYSNLESDAHRVIAEDADALGLQVTRDAALNLFARLPGRDRNAPALHVGSHLDTVPMGGAYDGTAGVVGAMALATAFAKSGEAPPADIVVTVTRAEESVWFPVSYVGSRAALGRLTAPEMQAKRADSGRTLADHMLEQGGDPGAVLRSPGLAPARFVELHIEQGPLLDKAAEAFGIVHGVRGGLRYRDAFIEGIWAHSGGAPRAARSDAVFALADLIVAMDHAWGAILEEGHDLAVTFGRVDAATTEHAFAKVPGRVDFCVDIRSDDAAILERVDRIFQDEIEKIEKAREVRVVAGAQSRSQPTRLSSELGHTIAAAAAAFDLKPRFMLSGGGHDAAAFAQAGWESVMVFLRNWNGSHNPDEAMNPEDLVQAVRVLHHAWSGGKGEI
ncbi:hydantoinase/carbamoylase family amidase (plasmid) [Rhizobium ruizarguesonis]|uniref:Zn-dependent hydrolase n=2 Tax=Rhizobium TaxID=379 RepID=A0A179BR49_RHILE|nr:hydantoinase/carbamoylase family amidase [Rhizobium leguminosarum]OAP93770.1 Zn-dependent hydrolase [Rhizobium leguminosarum]